MLKRVWFLSGLLPLLSSTLADEFTARPSSGEQVWANQTYFVNWNVTGPTTVEDQIGLLVPNETPPYTSTFEISSPNYITMTTTGYINMFFTEINPTSTTTVITVVYNTHYFDEASYFIGPFTVLPHTLPVITPPFTQQPVTPAATPATTPATATTTTVTAVTSSSTTASSSPNREFLAVVLFLAIYWFSSFPLLPL